MEEGAIDEGQVSGNGILILSKVLHFTSKGLLNSDYWKVFKKAQWMTIIMA